MTSDSIRVALGASSIDGRALVDAEAGIGKASPEKSSGSRTHPVPPPYAAIQVNHCKTPGCVNFGVPPRDGVIPIGPFPAERDGYWFRGAGSENLLCQHCETHTRLANNKNIHEELERQGSHLWAATLRCPNTACANHIPDRASSIKGRFRRFGKTRVGSDRWQCCLCDRTLSIAKPMLYQREPQQNLTVFNLLVNRVPIERIIDILGIRASGFYRKIDAIYEQCQFFTASHESRLREMRLDRLYLSTGRRNLVMKSGDLKQLETIQRTLNATVDLKSGYVFGLTPNFESSTTQDDAEEAFAKRGDHHAAYALHKHQKSWVARETFDAPGNMGALHQLPKNGVQFDADCLVYGHFALLRHLFPYVGKLRFFLNQDPGLLAACLGLFADRIGERTADIVVADCKKDMPIDERRRSHADARRWFDRQLAANPGLGPHEVRTKIVSERIEAIRATSLDPKHALQMSWISHPSPDMAEPEKRFRCATDYGDYDDEHMANLLNMATLRPVDAVFKAIQRQMNCYERSSRTWQSPALCRPGMLEKMLFINRTWHNFVWVSPKTDKTAAELIGLAAAKIKAQDILHYGARRVH